MIPESLFKICTGWQEKGKQLLKNRCDVSSSLPWYGT